MDLAGLALRQPERGYRFSLDPFLLAAFVRPRPRELILDLGAGVGVIALILARRHLSLRTVALEIQPNLARYALENARANGLQRRCLVIRGDLREAPRYLSPGAFDRVVANPPYRAPGSGRVSADPSRAQARQELTFTPESLAAVAGSLLKYGGTLDFVHLAERIPHLFRALSAHRLEPKVLRLVSPAPGRAPRLCLVSARKGGRPGLKVLPPLVVHEAPEKYGREVARALGGWCPRATGGKKRQTCA